jgi:hypothetical protein
MNCPRDKVPQERGAAQGKYKGRKPTARAKAEEAIRLFRERKKVAHIATALGIG